MHGIYISFSITRLPSSGRPLILCTSGTALRRSANSAFSHTPRAPQPIHFSSVCSQHEQSEYPDVPRSPSARYDMIVLVLCHAADRYASISIS